MVKINIEIDLNGEISPQALEGITKLAALDLSTEHKQALGKHNYLAYDVHRKIKVSGNPSAPNYELEDGVATRALYRRPLELEDLCFAGMQYPIASGEVKRMYSHQALLKL